MTRPTAIMIPAEARMIRAEKPMTRPTAIVIPAEAHMIRAEKPMTRPTAIVIPAEDTHDSKRGRRDSTDGTQ